MPGSGFDERARVGGIFMIEREDLWFNHPTRIEAFAKANASILQILTRKTLEKFGTPALAKRRIIGIAGAGCLGKSTLAEVFAETLHLHLGYDCDWLELDGYLIEKERREASCPIISGYNPKGYELDEAENQLRSWLTTGEVFEVRVYDKLTSKRTGCRKVQARDLLVVEGVCALCESVTDLSNFKVFLEASREVQYANRWQRERTDLGRSDSQIQQKFQTLYPDYEMYILPTREMADVVLQVKTGYELSLDQN